MYFTSEQRTKVGFHEGKFCIDGGELFPGYAVYGESWNGWACPYFTFDVAKRIIDGMPDDENNTSRYEEELDAFLFFDKNDEEYDADEGEIYQPYTCTGADIVVGGKTIHVYDIGAGAWVWDEIEEHEPIHCAFCETEIEDGDCYMECKDPRHGEPQQFCSTDCMGNYLINHTEHVCKTYVKQEIV